MRSSSFMCLAAILLMAGCSSESKQPYESSRTFFGEESEPRAPRQIANQQAMLGAQADPTLYSCHFDGNDLNALGRTKLDDVLAAHVPTVYVDTGSNSAIAHRSAVSAYLTAAKVADGAIAIETGAAAPGASTPAAASISRMKKTESSGMGSASSETSADNSSTTSGNRLFGQ